MAKKQTAHTPLASIRHQEKRANIPTEELRDFVAEDEQAPKVMLYPRDVSLDPQLVWKGKDEQDRQDLTVPVVPIYIQEKIHPRSIIDDFKKSVNGASASDDSKKQDSGEQMELFAAFNGGPHDFEQKVEFYQHEQNWTNRMILGDSLLVMTSLAEKEGLKGKVQTIYLDPPYGIKFGSNWQVSTRKRDVKDGKAEDATRQPEQVRAFRDTWKLGIHSYLAYLRDRLVSARELLTETGSVFVQIGDENVHLVRCVMDEVFGAENFCAQISFRTTGGQAARRLASVCDLLLWYAKDQQVVKYRQVYADKLGDGDTGRYQWVESLDGSTIRELSSDEQENPKLLPNGWRLLVHDNITSQGISGDSSSPFVWNGREYQLPASSHWKTTPSGMAKLATSQRLMAIGATLRFKRFLDDFPVSPIDCVWEDTATSGFGRKKQYVVETNVKVVERCLLMTTDPGDIVLDPTCGSGTTAYVAEQWGRRWITCDTSRVALALARTRLMSAKYPYYLLADSPEGVQKETELTGQMQPASRTTGDIRRGFVYKRVPHVTLKSIANNPDIREGMSRAEIDAAIARHADSETLYDQPYEDAKRVRVCGPFTVESLSPHRVLSSADENLDGMVSPEEQGLRGDFTQMILDNLKKAGVQNTIKNERLKFDALDSYAGVWVHAEGKYTDAEGRVRRVAVSVGPEHGTVGPTQVKEAAKEAVQGVGFDMLVVCGFAFDPHVSEETKRYGKLQVLSARMNPDLAMGEEMLKKTGAGNLFMVFGEPDVEIVTPPKSKGNKTADSNSIVVKIKGLDIYDPTTGQIRSSSTDDIACWFIDTDYNGESFFVRHAYFTGAEEPYDKLKRALRAEIDEAAWTSLYRTESRPFPRPESGKIAVKVINHYGDEVLRVLAV